ncbi:unnamed protein product [Ceutorhynchus assimilis]|uniref:Regulatory protein zeste n=1 Tax=Ceutorhynchus assimilis TaxID=467358 RepID=A0A9P0DCM1_9CUCU|nr:unnamed protein product [Ceutorhynchus assimilis]
MWKKIAQEYNSAGPSCPRAVECLKRCYENRKKLLRKSVAAERREIYKTGGGLPDNQAKKEPLDDLLMSIVSNKSVQGLETPFGGDAIININTSNPTTSQESQDVILEDNAIEFIFENDHEDSIFEFEDTIEEKKASQGKPEEKKRKATTSMESETQKLKQNQSKNWKRYTVQDLKSATDSALNPESMLVSI